MITPSNLIRLPYTPDLTEGGIAHALHSLPYSFDQAGNYQRLYQSLRHLVAGAAVEIAFRRYLSLQEIPFEVQPAPAFTDIERYDVSLNHRRCELHSYWISHREQMLEMRRSPEILLNAPALVPSDVHAREGHRRDDLYIFAFLAGRLPASPADAGRALAPDQPDYLVSVLPQEWRRPQHWNPLGTLTLKSDSEEELLVEIHGQAGAREAIRKTISLPPKTRVTVHEAFHSISALHVRRLPDARVGLHCEALRETLVITSSKWGDIWVHGMDIFLAGYLGYEEFGKMAKPLPINARTFQYEHTKVKNLYVPVSNLKPLQDLLK